MLAWIRKLLHSKENSKSKELSEQIKKTNKRLASIEEQITSMSFIIRKQSELIAAIASVQSEILQSIDYEAIYETALDETSVEKIILSLPDDDDIFH